MKRLIATVLFACLTLGASAQVFQSQSFLNAQSVAVTNTLGITNLTAIVDVLTQSNLVGTIYTNLAGTKVEVTGTNDATVNLCRTVNLWADRNAAFVYPIYTNSVIDATTNMQAVQALGPYSKNIYIRLVGASGANSAVTFIFAPVPSSTGVEDTTAAKKISIAVTATTTTQVQSTTLLDESALVGCKGLKLISITNGDTDASSRVTVLECSLNGFVP